MKTGNRNIKNNSFILNHLVAIAKLVFIIIVFIFSNNAVSQTKVVKTNNGYQLMRNGQPYYVKGVGGQVNFDKMIEIAKKLSKRFPFVRCDLYDCDGKVYFGELTFYPGKGTERFSPRKADNDVGAMLSLSDC